MKFHTVITILILFLAGMAPALAASDLRWPLDLSPQVSATFMEYRNARFHAGLDLRTGGKTGKPVRAPFSGWVSRLRVTETGYGRMLELTNSQGESIRFAHLESYDDSELKLESRILAVRKNRFARYPVEMAFSAGEIPVRSGQIVARSGDSGAGPAHLHMEWREKGSALDPLQQFPVRIKDTIPPEWTRLYLVPASSNDRVAGQTLPLEIPLPVPVGLRIAVSGRVEVLAACLDRKDGVGNRLNPQKIQLDVNGRLHSRFDFRQVSLDRLNQAKDVFDRSRSSLGRGHYVFFLTPPRNNLSNLHLEGPTGALEVKTPLKLRLLAEDHNGNKAVQHIELVPQSGTVKPADVSLKSNRHLVKSDENGWVFWLEDHPGLQSVSRGSWQSYGGKKPPRAAYFLSAQGVLSPLLVPGPLPSGDPDLELDWADGRVRLVLTAGNAEKAVWLGPISKEMVRISPAGFLVNCELDELPGDGRFQFRLEGPGGVRETTLKLACSTPGADSLESPDQKLRLNWLPDTFPASGRVFIDTRRTRSAAGWSSGGDDWRVYFFPPPARAVNARVLVPRSGPGSHLCRVDQGVEILENAVYTGEGYELKLQRGVTLGIRTDRHPPAVKGTKNVSLQIDQLEKTLELHYKDSGSGVDRSGVSLRVDGRKRDVDFIDEDGVIRLPFYPWDPPGKLPYILEVADRAGMKTIHQGTVILSQSGHRGTAPSGGKDFPSAKKKR